MFETGDKSDYVLEDNYKESDTSTDSNTNNACIHCPIRSDPRIGHNHQFYFCKERPKVQNINLETIELLIVLYRS